MFTGIVQALGVINAIEQRGSDVRFVVETGKLDTDRIRLGDSVLVNGVCLTAVELDGGGFLADVSNETLSCTTLKQLRAGVRVNLELALTPSARMGGHIVSGHVDGVSRIEEMYEDGRSMRFDLGLPESLSRYVAVKGSICVDGISLTVNEVKNDAFSVNIVPHTLDETTLGTAGIGQPVNLEVDLLARYIERLLSAGHPSNDRIGMDTLKNAGFL
ncbi:MAG: riboflavin synthase [Methylococcales bacterium]|nr:riboflavin synthase [Methylococcales bacterium]